MKFLLIWIPLAGGTVSPPPVVYPTMEACQKVCHLAISPEEWRRKAEAPGFYGWYCVSVADQ